MRKVKRDGFSLVELLIAITISAIVMASVIALMGYASRSMNDTQSRVSLQDQAKDTMNHISVYAQEGTYVIWNDAKKLLIIKKDTIKNDDEKASVDADKTRYSFYWYHPAGKMLCYDTGHDVTKGDALTALSETEAKKHMLAEYVEDFQCEIDKSIDSGKQMIHINLKMVDERAEFACSKDITMRNQ